MAYEIATLLKNGGDDCHYQFIEAVRVLAEANGWTTLRSVTTGDDREWIGQSTDNIFIGLKSYQSAVSDYYNLKCGVFIGYIAENSFENQPGAEINGCPAHNNAITYFININPRRIVVGLKVGTPVYTHFYLGKYIAWARPQEYPLPICSGACLNGTPATRFSDANYEWCYQGQVEADSYMRLRRVDGSWIRTFHYPFGASASSQNHSLFGNIRKMSVPAGNVYQLEPIIMMDTSDVYGEFEGVFAVSGFNNAVENVLQQGGSSTIDQSGLTIDQAVAQILGVGGRAFVVMQNINRTTFNDFVAIEMN